MRDRQFCVVQREDPPPLGPAEGNVTAERLMSSGWHVDVFDPDHPLTVALVAAPTTSPYPEAKHMRSGFVHAMDLSSMRRRRKRFWLVIASSAIFCTSLEERKHHILNRRRMYTACL